MDGCNLGALQNSYEQMSYTKLEENFTNNWWQVSASALVILNPNSSCYYRGLALGIAVSYMMDWKAEPVVESYELLMNSVDLTPEEIQ